MKQGYFRYYKLDGTYDELFAVDGFIYKFIGDLLVPLTVAIPLQKDRMMEAVQFGPTLYIATGTKLLTYDGTACNVVNPYLPTTTEMTYIGSNALADDPEAHLQDSTGLVASIDYLLPVLNTLASNKSVCAKVYGTKVTGETYQYAMQIRYSSHQGEAWNDPASTDWKSLGTDHVLSGPKVVLPGQYEMRVVMRKTGTTDIISEAKQLVVISIVPRIEKSSDNTIHQCTRIILHWGRLMLYGDPNNPATLYMSHLNTPNYFPALLNIEFDSPRREALMSIIHYRNSLVAFTKTSTQALYGTGPEDYRRTMLHTDLGCISPYGAAVMKNGIGFLSMQGIYSLKTMALTDDKATVEKLDIKIDNIVPKDTDTLVLFDDGQLQITFPSRKTRLRYYYELGSWTKDYSDKFDLAYVQNIDGDVFALGSSALYVFDSSVFNDDDYNYENHWESK
jgi:hypothetical protein